MRKAEYIKMRIEGMKKIPPVPSPKKKEKKKICSRCKKKIDEDSDWQLIFGDLFCEKCVDSGIIFRPQKKEKSEKKRDYQKRPAGFSWNDPINVRGYWNKRYPVKRKDLCSCGNPKRKESEFCKSCHNKNLIFLEKKHLRDSSGRFVKIP